VCRCGRAPDRTGRASPVDDPPDAEVLLVHGDADEHVSVVLSRRYAAGATRSTSSSSAAATWSTSIRRASRLLAGNWLERLLAA